MKTGEKLCSIYCRAMLGATMLDYKGPKLRLTSKHERDAKGNTDTWVYNDRVQVLTGHNAYCCGSSAKNAYVELLLAKTEAVIEQSTTPK